VIKKWYQIGDERKKLTQGEAEQHTDAVQVTCPECIYELENGRAVPEGVVHECDKYLDLTFRPPTKEELKKLEHPGPPQCELVLHHYFHGTLKKAEK
jgi:hypothetical protein